MLLCLTCRFVSPSGSLRCGRCGRSFGGRLCPRHHLSPVGSRFCVQCGHQDLTEATIHLPLAWLSRLLTWSMILLFAGGISRHAGGLVRVLWAMACWGLIHLLGVCPGAIIQAIVRTLAWLAILFLLSFLLPGAAGSRFRASLVDATVWVERMVFGLLRSAVCWVYSYVEGAPKKDDRGGKKKSRHAP